MTNFVSLPIHCATGLNVANDTQFRWLTVTILAVGHGRAGAIGDGSRVPHSGTRKVGTKHILRRLLNVVTVAAMGKQTGCTSTLPLNCMRVGTRHFRPDRSWRFAGPIGWLSAHSRE